MNLLDIDMSEYPHALPGENFPSALPLGPLVLAVLVTAVLGASLYFDWASFSKLWLGAPVLYLCVRASLFNVIRHAVRAGMNDQAEDVAKVHLLSQFMADKVNNRQGKTLSSDVLKARFMGEPVT